MYAVTKYGIIETDLDRSMDRAMQERKSMSVLTQEEEEALSSAVPTLLKQPDQHK